MPWITPRMGVALAIALLFGPGLASGQPGQPFVQIRSDFSVAVTYAAPTAPPAEGALLVATYNGAVYPGSPFNIGQATTVSSPPLPFGTYTVQVVWGAEASPVATFVISPELGAPTILRAGVDLNTVTLTWAAAAGVVAGYDIEATLVGVLVYFAQLGPETSLTVRGAFPGTYSARIRARNAYGVGPYSAPIELVVGERVEPAGDLQVTLTWNTTADIDLHLLEPDFSHVYYGNKEGSSGRLDFDDVDGYGPENILVSQGRSLPGIYQVYLVHSGQDVETTSTVSLTLGDRAGTPKTLIFTRRTRRAEPRTAVMVAMVNVRTGEIVEMVNPAGAALTVNQEVLLNGATVAEKSK